MAGAIIIGEAVTSRKMIPHPYQNFKTSRRENNVQETRV